MAIMRGDYMAAVTRREGKNNRVSYLIRVSDGYKQNGERIRYSKTWIPKPGWSERKTQRELHKQIFLFEDTIKSKYSQEGIIKFQHFAERFLNEYAQRQLKSKTVDGYTKLLQKINNAIGHIRLCDLKTSHLNAFYSYLHEGGMNRRTGGLLSASSIRGYHRVISSILTKAVKWGFIASNPALNAEPPKIGRREAAYLDEDDVRRLLTLLHNEPIKYRAMVSFSLLSGLRRGELLGLRWQDVDFDSETISVVQTSSYVKGRGVYVSTPKNESSVRPLKLSKSTIALLNEYKKWQDGQKVIYGIKWNLTDGRVFTSEDGVVINPDSLSRWFKCFIKKHGFPNISLHSLRHTYASILIADGTPIVVVSKRLGHAQVSTTSDIYSHLIKSADEKAAHVTDKFEDIIINK